MNRNQLGHADSMIASEQAVGAWQLTWGWAVLLLGAICAQGFYLSCGHVWDDLRHLHNIGEVLCGRSNWQRFFLAFHNEHFLPLWKLWYAGTWQVAGISPQLWHLGIILFHSISALALGGLIRESGGTLLVSRLTAVLWAIATIGGFDNPLIWIASSHFAMSTMWVLLASWATASYLRMAKSWKLVLVVCFLSAAGMTMSASIVVSIIVPLMALSHKAATTKQKWQVVALWMIPVALIAGWQLWTKLEGNWVTPSREYAKEYSPFVAAAECFMLAGSRTLLGNDMLGSPLLVLLLGAVGVIWKLSGSLRRLMLCMTLAVLGQTTLAAVARIDFAPEHFASMGRYTYLPTLIWCSLTGIVLASIAESPWFRQRRAVRVILCISLLGGVFATQLYQAKVTAAAFAVVNEPSAGPWVMNLRRIDAWNAFADEAGEDLRLPEMPVPSRSFVQPLSGLIAYAKIDDCRLVVVPSSDLSASEQERFVARLEAGGEDIDRAWLVIHRFVAQYESFFEELTANSSGPVSLFNFDVTVPASKPMRVSSFVERYLPAFAAKVQFRNRAEMSQYELYEARNRLSSMQNLIAKELLKMENGQGSRK